MINTISSLWLTFCPQLDQRRCRRPEAGRERWPLPAAAAALRRPDFPALGVAARWPAAAEARIDHYRLPIAVF